jgi:rod shape determining protein RodA
MRRFLAEYFDIRVFLTTLALVIIGLVSIYSATYDARASEIFWRQLTWAGVGLAALLIVTFLPLRSIQFVALGSYALSIMMLVIVLVLGKTVSGSTSWFTLGAFGFQPSEFAKIGTVLALATFLSRSDVSLRSPKHLAVTGGIIMLPVLLVMMQPDTGTALIFLAMAFPVLYWGGASRFTLLALAAAPIVALAALFGTTPFVLAVIVLGILLALTSENRVVTASVFSMMVLVGISTQSIYDGLKPYQQKRIDAFLDPAADPLGAGYNILQSTVAIGSGGVFGRGYLQGTQTQLNFIPEQWTDFIFCVPSEEFGFLGATLVLVLFLLLLVRSLSLATTVKSRFASLVGIGVWGILGSHVLVNIGMSLGLLPVIGVPLPFLSYGGSSLISCMIMAGLIMNLYATRKEH